MKSQESNFPKLINDTPSLEDRLGAHKRIADTLCEIVRSNQGGKTIALEGEWGAGKSTVIKLVQQNLEKNSNHLVVIYDAWVHAGDPLRRAFLSALIDELLGKKWLKDAKHWSDKKEHLARRVKDSEKITTPTFTLFGKLLLLTMLLVPLASVLFSGLYMSLARSDFSDFTLGSGTGLGLIVAGIFSILPFGLVILKAFIGWISGKSSDDWALILNKSSISEKTLSIETPDPTTIEFQEVFNEALTKALEVETKKLILVIDNLDRLSVEEAELVWSMLRSFIDNPAFNESSWMGKLWIVVPVATSIVKTQSWAESVNTIKSGQAIADAVKANKDKFLEKVFQVRLALPPPVLADWKNYLELLLKEAFGDLEQEHFSNVHRIYEVYIQDARDDSHLTPTPRELVIFTNELVALKIQWKDLFSISLLAAYILSTRKTNVIPALQKRSIPSGRILRLLNHSQVIADFAAIYFNLDDKLKAQHLLLRPVVEKGLMNGEEQELLSNLIADRSFEHIIDSVIAVSLGDWALENPEFFFNSMIVLNRIENPTQVEKENSEPEPHINKYVFNDVTKNCVTTQGVKSINNFPALPLGVKNCAEGIINFIELTEDIQIDKAVMSSLRRMNSVSEEYKSVDAKIVPSDQNIEQWLEQLDTLVKHDRIAAMLPRDGNSPIALPITQELWASFCCKFTSDINVLSAFSPSFGLSEVEKYISENCIKSYKFGWEEFSTIKREADLSNITFLNSISQSITAQLFSQPTIDFGYIESMLWTILYLENKNENYKLALTDIVNSGWIHHHLYAMVVKEKRESAAILILAILKARPNPTLPVVVGNGQAGQTILTQLMTTPAGNPEVTEAIVQGIEELSLHRLLIDIPMNAPTPSGVSGFVFAAAGLIKNVNDIYAQFSLTSSDDFAKEVETYLNCAYPKNEDKTKPRNEIVRFNVKSRNLLSLLSEESNRELKNDWLYATALSVGGINDENYVAKCIEMCRGVDETTWLPKVSSYSWAVMLINELVSKGKVTNFGSPLRNAMLSVAKKAMNGSEAIGIEEKYLSNLANSLQEIHKHGFAEDMFDIAAQPATQISPVFWEKFGFAVSSSVQRQFMKVRAIRTIVKPMVARGDIAGLKWFANLLKEVGIERIDDDKMAIGDFVEAANDSIIQQNAQSELVDLLTNILELLGQPYKPPLKE